MDNVNNIPIMCEINSDAKLFHILLNTARPGRLYFDYICEVEPENIIVIDRYTDRCEYLFTEIITITFKEGHKKIAVINGGDDFKERVKDAKIFKMNIVNLTKEEREKGIESLIWSDEWLYNKVTNKQYMTQEEFEEEQGYE